MSGKVTYGNSIVAQHLYGGLAIECLKAHRVFQHVPASVVTKIHVIICYPSDPLFVSHDQDGFGWLLLVKAADISMSTEQGKRVRIVLFFFLVLGFYFFLVVGTVSSLFPCFPLLFLRFSLGFLHFSSLFPRFPVFFFSFS